MSRPNHPLPESPATRAGRFAFFFIVIRKNGSGRFFLRKSIIKEIDLEVKKKKKRLVIKAVIMAACTEKSECLEFA
jgi:hypothetical protein